MKWGIERFPNLYYFVSCYGDIMGMILLAYDSSEHSRKALDKAITMSGKEEKIIVLYVIPDATLDEFKDMAPETTKAKAWDIVNEAIEIIIAREKQGIAVVREGDIAHEIIHYAKELECNLIIIGSKGISKIGRFSLGSVAEAVAKNAETAVLIIK